MSKICYSQISFDQDFEGTLEWVKNATGWVDDIIIVEDGSFSKAQVSKLEEVVKNSRLKRLKFLKKINAARAKLPEPARALTKSDVYSTKLHVLVRPFKDNLPEFRNQYLVEAQRLGADFILVSDADEFFNNLFFQNVHSIVERAEKDGYDMLGINSHDQFDAVDWVDDLDMLKEYPGKYGQSNYWKYLLFKNCCKELRYYGIGVSKTVHETWYCPVHSPESKWKAINLPQKYWYLHKKSAIRVWRNAARNVVLGGGGNNAGSINTMWVKLKEHMSELGLKDWHDFEQLVLSGEIKLGKSIAMNKLVNWVQEALVWKANNYGTEVRETAKFTLFYNRHLLEIESIAHGIKNPPRPTEEDKVEQFVMAKYFEILHRHPDAKGLNDYKTAILNGTLLPEDLEKHLKGGDEYREKFGPKEERLPLEVPIHVDIGISPELVLNTLAKTQSWSSEYKPSLDVGRFLLERVKDRKEFLSWFYEHENQAGLEELLKRASAE